MTTVIEETTVTVSGIGRPSLRARVARTAVAMLALLLATPSVVSLRNLLQPERAFDKDFGQEYLLARAMADGVNPYQPIRDLAARYLSPTGLLDKPFPTPHPPTAGVLFSPFLLVDYPTAAQIWSGISIVALIVGVAVAARSAGLKIPWPLLPIVALALLAWRPVVVDLGMGQVTLVLLPLLGLSEYALLVRRNALGGALLGISMAVKPLMWPWLLVLMWRRNWAAILGAASVLVVSFALVAVKVGISPILGYLTSVLPSDAAMYATETTNISLWTLGPRLFGGVESALFGGALPPLISSPALAHLVAIAVPTLVLGGSLLWLRMRPQLAIALGVMTCIGILVNPISWEYDLVLLLLPGTQVLAWLVRHNFPKIPTLLAACTMLSLFVAIDQWQTVARRASELWTGTNEVILPSFGLLALAPSLAVAALCVYLIWQSAHC